MRQQVDKQTNQEAALLRRILIVDDEAGFTRLLKLNLEATGRYSVQVENDPNLALPAAIQFRPELVLMDVMMPGVDGGDVVNRFAKRAELARIPVVFLTATVRHAEVDSHSDGCFGGMRFLAKPVEMAELLDCLEEQFST